MNWKIQFSPMISNLQTKKAIHELNCYYEKNNLDSGVDFYVATGGVFFKKMTDLVPKCC